MGSGASRSGQEFKMPKMVKVHVTFNETKRILSLQMGGEVKDLRHLVLQVFSDVLLDQVAPAAVKLQRYDSSFEDYVELNGDEKLKDDIKIRALVSKPDKQDSGCKDHGSENYHIHAHSPHAHSPIPWYPVRPQEGSPPDIKFHRIEENVPYRLWSPVGNGLLQIADPENPSIVNCNATFVSKNSENTVIKAKLLGMNVYNLYFSEVGDDQYITAKEKGQSIDVERTPTEESRFEPDYYWGNTVFKSRQCNTLYLGCDENKMATLVPMEYPDYPNPQAFFIVNKYNPI